MKTRNLKMPASNTARDKAAWVARRDIGIVRLNWSHGYILTEKSPRFNPQYMETGGLAYCYYNPRQAFTALCQPSSSSKRRSGVISGVKVSPPAKRDDISSLLS